MLKFEGGHPGSQREPKGFSFPTPPNSLWLLSSLSMVSLTSGTGLPKPTPEAEALFFFEGNGAYVLAYVLKQSHSCKGWPLTMMPTQSSPQTGATDGRKTVCDRHSQVAPVSCKVSTDCQDTGVLGSGDNLTLTSLKTFHRVSQYEGVSSNPLRHVSHGRRGN